MDTTSPSCNRSRAEVEYVYSRARKIAKRWSYRTQSRVDQEDMVQDIMLHYVEKVADIKAAANPAAYLELAIKSGAGRHLQWVLRKAYRLTSDADDVSSVEIPEEPRANDFLLRDMLRKEINARPDRQRHVLTRSVYHDDDPIDFGMTTDQFGRHMAQFIAHMQDKLGLEKVKKLKPRGTVYRITNGKEVLEGTMKELAMRVGVASGNLHKVTTKKGRVIKGWRLA